MERFVFRRPLMLNSAGIKIDGLLNVLCGSKSRSYKFLARNHVHILDCKAGLLCSGRSLDLRRCCADVRQELSVSTKLDIKEAKESDQ